MKLIQALLVPAFVFALQFSFASEIDTKERFEPIPHGFEKRRYILGNLVSARKDLEANFDQYSSSSTSRLDSEIIMEIIRSATAPDSWTTGGPAEMTHTRDILVVIQKPEVHEEIAKIISWLRESTATPCRTTVVFARLKPQQFAKLQLGNGMIATAELFEMLEEAGDTAAQVIELRGLESQKLCSVSSYREGGSIDDERVLTLTGFLAKTQTRRLPDGLAARVDLFARNNFDPTLIGSSQQVQASLTATVVAPCGQFVLAGICDISPGSSGRSPDRRAILVRAEVGNVGIPSFQYAAKGKNGKVSKMYPIQAIMSEIEDAPAVPQTFRQQDPTGRALEPIKTAYDSNVIYGSNTMFAHLNGEDHAKLSLNMMNRARHFLGGVRVRAVALALPQTVSRKLLLVDSPELDDNDVEALTKIVGTKILADTVLTVQPGQTTSCRVDGSIKGYSMELGYIAQNNASIAEVTARMRVYWAIEKKHFTFDTILQGTATLTKTKFMLAASSAMPVDSKGKADPRQAILLLRADDAIFH